MSTTTSPVRVFDTPTPVLVRLEFGAGSVHIDAVDTDTATVDLQPVGNDRSSQEAADAAVVEQRGDEIFVKVPRRWRGLRAPRLALRMTVPTSSRLSAEISSADLIATGCFGVSEISTGSGDVTIDVVDGDARITSGSGDITIAAVHGNSQIRAGSGDVRVDVAGGSIHVGTGSGDIFAGRVDVDFVGKSGSGDVRVDDARGSVSMGSGSGNLRVGRIGQGKVSAKAASGDVEVGVSDGAAVWLDLKTVSGRLERELEESGPPEAGQPVVELRASTVSGNMRVYRV